MRAPARIALAALLLAAAPQADASEISGRIVHPTRPEAGGGIEVSLLGFKAEGGTLEQKTRSDAEGRFRFVDLPPGGYFVAATYQDIVFPGGRAVFQAGQPARMESIFFHVYDRSEDVGRISLRGLRWIVEREAGVYRISQVLSLGNPTSTVIQAPASAPAPFRMRLAAGHGEVEAPLGHLQQGVEVNGDLVEVRGPFFPGSREFVVSYELEPNGDSLETTFLLPEGVEFSEVWVRDFGVLADVDRLHPARAVQQNDEMYLRWVGFELPGDTPVSVHLRPMPPHRPLPRALQALLLAGLAAGTLIWVLRPVGGGFAPAAEEVDVAADEREALASALRDLEHDFETGKLSPEDRERLRADLRRETLRAMERTRARPEPGAAGSPVCVCGRRAAPGDRFCAACGKPL